MYQRAGQTSGSSTVMPPSSGPANTANKSVNDYTSNYGTNYGMHATKLRLTKEVEFHFC